jgi:hypothetical protein
LTTVSVLAANAFNVIFLEQLLGPLMRADLLLGIGLVEIVLMRRVQIVDHALMLLVERGRQLNVDLVALDDTLEFGGGLRVRLDHVLAKLLDGV